MLNVLLNCCELIEVFAEFGHELRRELPFVHFYFNGLSNKYCALHCVLSHLFSACVYPYSQCRRQAIEPNTFAPSGIGNECSVCSQWRVMIIPLSVSTIAVTLRPTRDSISSPQGSQIHVIGCTPWPDTRERRTPGY